MKKLLVTLVAITLIASLFAGCAPKEEAATATMEEGEVYEFVFIVKSMQMPFFLSMIEGAEAFAATMPNVNLKCVGPETPYSVEEQIQLVEQAIIDGVDGIIITPADSEGIVPAIKKANEAGIPVTTPNTKAYGGDVVAWVGVDNYDVGYQLGTAFCEALNGEGKVLLLEGTPGNSTSEERVQGYKDAIAENPGIELLDSQPADFNREKGMQVMENWLQKYPEIDGVCSIQKEMTMGAVEAIKTVGRENEIIQVTFDVDTESLDALESGDILLTGGQNEKSQAANAIAACYLAVVGYKVPPIQYLPLSIVSKEDVSDWR